MYFLLGFLNQIHILSLLEVAGRMRSRSLKIILMDQPLLRWLLIFRNLKALVYLWIHLNTVRTLPSDVKMEESIFAITKWKKE